MYQYFIPFYDWTVRYCVKSHLITWWTSEPFPLLGSKEKCWSEYLCTSLCVDMFSVFWGYIAKSGTAGHKVNCMFKHLRNCQDWFPKYCTISHLHQQGVRVLISLHSHQYLLLSVFVITPILAGVKWYLVVVWICISLTSNDWATFPMLVGHLYVFGNAYSILPIF